MGSLTDMANSETVGVRSSVSNSPASFWKHLSGLPVYVTNDTCLDISNGNRSVAAAIQSALSYFSATNTFFSLSSMESRIL